MQGLLSKISSQYSRKAILYTAKKLTIIEDLCLNFKNVIVLKFEEIVLRNFTRSLEKQYSYLVWSEVYSNKYSGSMISAIVMGALYLIWCDELYLTKSIETLILIIVYSNFVRNLFLEFCDCIHGIVYGIDCLDKLKV